MIIILKISIIFYLILNVINLIETIRNNIKHSFIFSLFNFIFSCVLMLFLLDQNVGLECLIQEFLVIVNFIIMLLSLIIGFVKKYKNIEANKNNKKVLLMLFILIIPLIMSYSAFLIEINIIKKGEIIFIYNYQNGITQSDYYTYVANEKNVRYVDIGHKNIEKYTKFNLDTKNYTNYNLDYNNLNNEYEVKEKYIDNSLEKFDKKLVNQILKDVKDNHYKNNELSDISICRLDETEYYIVRLNEKQFLYKGEKYIADIRNSSGNISEVFLIKK